MIHFFVFSSDETFQIQCVFYIYIAHSNTGFSSEIFNLKLDFVRFAIGNVDSQSQVVPNILHSFPVTEKSISLKFFKLKLSKIKNSFQLCTLQVPF